MKNLLNNSQLINIFQLLLAVLIITCPVMAISQTLLNKESVSPVERINSLENVINQKLKAYQKNVTHTNSSSIVLDSVHELEFNGIYIQKNRTYFDYNSRGQLSASVKQFNFDEKLNVYTIENTLYNEQEKITDFTRTHLAKREELGDTSVIVYSEHNIYSDGFLSSKRIFHANYWFLNQTFTINDYDSLTYTNTYQYNDQNQLSYSNIFVLWSDTFLDGNFEETNYHYNSKNLLKYKHRLFGITKYDYDTINDICLKYEKTQGIELENKVELFDTITQWYANRCDETTYDALGRLNTLRNTNMYYFDSITRYNFKARFEYNIHNKLSHASYYIYQDYTDSTSYYEETRIDNSYDSEGNILEYHKTFYDLKDKQWKTLNKKTYYYSNNKKAVDINNNELSKITLYPNPANNTIHLLSSDGFSGEYSIYNLNGQLVTKATPFSSTINISQLQNSIYILKLQSNNNFKVLKFIKE